MYWNNKTEIYKMISRLFEKKRFFTKRLPKKRGVPGRYLCLFTFIFFFFPLVNRAEVLPAAESDADYALKTLQYKKAYQLYNSALEENPSLSRDRVFLLKRGIAALRAGDPKTAQSLLVLAKTFGRDFNDYIDYFTAVTAIDLGETNYAVRLLTLLPVKYSESILKHEASYLAGYLEHQRERSTESNELLLPLENYRGLVNGKNIVTFMIGLNFINLGREEEGEKRLMQVVIKSPADTLSLKSAELLSERRALQKRAFGVVDLLNLSAVYRIHGDLNKSARLIDDFFNRFPNSSAKARGHFERGRLRYSRRQYSRAIQDFNISFSTLKDPRKIRDSRYYIGRSLGRTGDRRGANREYTRYAREYPNDRRAAEVLWLIALSYERNKELLKASKAYSDLAKKTSTHSYKNRALFRAGYCLYKNNYLTKSSQYFNSLKKRYPGSALSKQAAFWEAKALEKLSKQEEASAIYQELSKSKLRNYYVITARERLNNPFVFTENAADISETRLPGKLNKAVLAGQIFGEPWGSKELNRALRNSGTSKQALINTYSAFAGIGVYDKAVMAADRLYNRYYHKKSERKVFEYLYPKHYSELILSIPDAKRVEDEFIFSIIRRESLFGHNAVSFAGARGLMQLMMPTANALAKSIGIGAVNVRDVFKPALNLQLGIKNIRELLQRFRQNKPAALAAYNSGDAAVRRWMDRYGTEDIDEFIENIEYSETNTFVKEVLKNYYFYRLLYANQAGN